MRIVAMGSTYGSGGVATHFRLLVNFLVRTGHRVGLIEVGERPAWTVQEAVFRCTIPHTGPSRLGMLRKSYGFWRARNAAVRFNPELFIATTTGHGYAALADALPSQTYKIRQEVLCDMAEDDPIRLRMARSFDAVAAQSPSIRSSYRRLIRDDTPVGVLPCFADPLQCVSLPRLPEPGEPIRFCYFGRLAENKGLAEFLPAFAKTAQQIDACLDIHGTGPEGAGLEKQIAGLGLTGRVNLCGRYEGGDAYAGMLASYHCLILPSRGYEGLPLVLIESMSCGLPFLATDVGAIADATVGNEDVMLMTADEDGMAQGLREMTSRLREGKIVHARLREYYQSHFSPEVLEASWRAMLSAPRSYFV